MDCLADIERTVAGIETCGDYRVLRRVAHSDLERRPASVSGLCAGLVIDTETTGLDPERDRIIEFAARMFWATDDGKIVAVGPSRSWLEDPREPLRPEIVRLTGLTDADLAFKEIDDVEVGDMLSRVDFIVAHNTRFDRPFVECRFPRHTGLAWCCSCQGIDWVGHDPIADPAGRGREIAIWEVIAFAEMFVVPRA